MKKYNTIFLDRDGTINPDPGYIASLDHFKFYDFTFSALQSLSNKGYRFCIVTNQSGVSRGLIKKNELDNLSTWSNQKIFNHAKKNIGKIYSKIKL